MQGGRGGRGNPFFGFGDPFGGFGGFGGGFGNGGSLLSNFFGGRDPFDDPFFTQPFGGMLESPFSGSNGSPFANMQPPAFIENQLPEPKKPRGPIIEELKSDDEKEAEKNKNDNPRKHGRSCKEPYVEDPDYEVEEKKSKQMQRGCIQNRLRGMQQQPQSHSFSFQSSAVTYGGANGTYYTSSKTRRTGSDGVTFEESKEADSSTRQARHRISRGLHNMGHTLARKLQPDGKVETMQTLHNLNEDELTGFEDAWKGKTTQHLPGLSGNLSGHSMGFSSNGRGAEAGQGGWALPSTEVVRDAGGRAWHSQVHNSVTVKLPSAFEDKTGHDARGRAKEQ